MTTQSFVLDYELAHPPAKVWRALTEPELLAKWLMANDMQARVGHRFDFTTDVKPTAFWDGVVHCEVLEMELHKRLRYTWRGGPLDTIVTWTLAPTASGGTRLTLEHSGFAPEAKQAFGGAKMGWEQKVGKLRELLGETT